MSNKLKIDLKYLEDGEDKVIHFEIGRVYNWAIREFQEMQTKAAEVQDLYQRLKEIEVERRAALREGRDDWVDIHKALKTEAKEITDKIREIADADFFRDRVKLVAGILKDNGYTDERFADFEFWDRQVLPNDLVIFLTKIIFKDLPEDDAGGRPGKK